MYEETSWVYVWTAEREVPPGDGHVYSLIRARIIRYANLIGPIRPLPILITIRILLFSPRSHLHRRNTSIHAVLSNKNHELHRISNKFLIVLHYFWVVKLLHILFRLQGLDVSLPYIKFVQTLIASVIIKKEKSSII